MRSKSNRGIEILVNGRFSPVVRYDNAHGYPHRDILWPDGTNKRKDEVPLSLKEALNFAHRDLTTNWERYARDFREDMRRHD